MTDGQYHATGNLDIKNSRLIKKGQSVKINIESIKGDHFIMGVVDHIDEYNGMGKLNIILYNIADNQYSILAKKPTGKASIYIFNKPILKRIFIK